MSSRIEVELTSAREGGTWTWRAAGARQPKGVVDASLLYEGAKVGDVVRADVEVGIDGIEIVSVLAPKAKRRDQQDRLEVVGPGRQVSPVTTSLVARRDGRRRERLGAPGEPRARDAGRGREGREGRAEERRRRAGPGAPGRRAEARTGGAGGRSAASGRDRSGGRARRLSPGGAHRGAVMRSLSPAERTVAEQILKGGLPAVRRAVDEQNRAAREQGRPEVRADALLGMAEELAPRLKAATWRDRAEAASKSLDDVSLRDLRSLVVGSEALTRDEEARALAAVLKEALGRRLGEARERWASAIGTALDEGQFVRALNLSARPPEPSAKLPAETAVRLRDASGQAMSAESTAEEWASLLEAVEASPVRRVVKPAGLPAGAGPDLIEAARRASGKVPALAPLLGIDMPPPPGPPNGHRPSRPGRPRPPQVPASR